MKVLYIEARKKFNNSDINLKLLDKLQGKSVSIAATIQYIGLIPKIKSYLENKGKKVVLKKGPRYEGHILGCNSNAFDKKSDILLLIADGKFHAINSSIQTQREIYIFNTKTLEKIEKNGIESQNKKILAKKKKFMLSEKVGILISNKYGQHIKNSKRIKEQIEKLNKKVYIFESNNIDVKEFENFPEIKIWINTACYGLFQDDPKIINLSDILSLLL